MRPAAAVFSLLPYILCAATSDETPRACMGLRLALNLSTVENRRGDVLTESVRAGMGTDLVVDYVVPALREVVALQIEAGYQQRGYDIADQRLKYGSPDINYSTHASSRVRLRLNYLDLSLLLKGRHALGRFTPTIGLGTTLSAFVKSYTVLSRPAVGYDTIVTTYRDTGMALADTTYMLRPLDAYAQPEDHDIALVFGCGLEIAASPRLIVCLELRYLHGLLVIERGADYRSRTAQGSVVIKAPFK